MPDYTFDTLSPIDFENLSRDLIQAEYSIRLETFKTGKDDGIDFRYAQADEGPIIVQAKHFVGTGFRGLLSHLKSKEKKKIEKLQPDCYLLTTSVPLSPGNKKKIIEVLSPFLKSPKDIYGKDDLNNLLGRYPDVEKQHFKLWLSSINILEEILHSRIISQSSFSLDNIRNKARLYVANQSFNEALKILKTYNYVVIAGIPGIGKTTLANMLALHYLRAGYEFIDVSYDITDAYSVPNNNRRRVILYDDFLGRTSLSEKLRTKEDQRLVKFIEAVRKTKSSKLILTTREYILTQAQGTYELLNGPIFEKPQCILDLSQYTRPIKAQILYNHLHFSKLPPEYIREIIRQTTYLEIIDHPNYSPRIIEYMTDALSLDCSEPSMYPAIFLSILKKPFLIWERAFCDHLSDIARNMLLVLASLPREIFVEDLISASKKLLFSKEEDSLENKFSRALAELQGNFIVIKREGKNDIVSFHSPSVQDFIEEYLEKNDTFYDSLCRSVYFFEQVEWLAKKGATKKIEKPIEQILSDSKNSSQKTCSLVNYEFGRGDSTYKARKILSYAEIIAFVASLLEKSDFAFLQNLFQNALKKFTINMLELDSSNWHLFGLVEKIVALRLTLDLRKNFLSAAKESLYLNSFSVSDVSYLVYFFELCPEMKCLDDNDRIEKKIEEAIKDNLENDDPGILSNEVDSLEEIESKTGIILEKYIEIISERLLFAEENIPPDPDYDQEDYREPSDTDSLISDEGLADMFSTLL